MILSVIIIVIIVIKHTTKGKATIWTGRIRIIQ